MWRFCHFCFAIVFKKIQKIGACTPMFNETECKILRSRTSVHKWSSNKISYIGTLYESVCWKRNIHVRGTNFENIMAAVTRSSTFNRIPFMSIKSPIGLTLFRKVSPAIIGVQSCGNFSTTSTLHADREYKLLIVGGGSAGCSIASKFTKQIKAGNGRMAILEPRKVCNHFNTGLLVLLLWILFAMFFLLVR